MGMVGATAAVLLRGWMRERARAASRRLQWVLTIVALQVMFDAFTPEVSSTAHLAGMLCGFGLGLLLYRPPASAARGFAPVMADATVPARNLTPETTEKSGKEFFIHEGARRGTKGYEEM